MSRPVPAALLLSLVVTLSLAWAGEEGASGGEAPPVSLEPLELSVPPLKLKPPHLGLPPGSWVRVSVRATLGPAGEVSEAEASGAEAMSVHRGELVPSEIHAVKDEPAARLKEAAKQAVRGARLRPREATDRDGKAPLSGRVDLIWRIPPKKARGETPFLEPARICRSARRSGGLWTCPGEESELVLLFLGPAAGHELAAAEEGGEVAETQRRVSQGLPRDPRALSDEIGVELLEEVPGEVLEPGKGVGVREAEVEAGRQGPPELPRELREDFAVEGDVDLLLVIDEKGTLTGILVRRGVPGFPEIAEAACRWLAKAEYRAARYKGTAYTSALRIRFPMRAAAPPLDEP